MTEPVSLIDRLHTMRLAAFCADCGMPMIPMTQFDIDTLDHAIAVITKLEEALALEDGAADYTIVGEERR